MVKRPDRNAREQRQLRRDYEARQAVHAARQRRKARDNWIVAIAAVLVCGGAIFAQYAYFNWGPGLPVPTASTTPDADATSDTAGDVPDAAEADDREWTGTITIGGVDLDVTFDGVNAPQATAVMVQASDTGWYDGKYCPRVTSYDTMHVLQCGTADPSSTASETDFSFGPIENAPTDGVYTAGTIAMARQSDDGSSMAHQFFIVTEDSTIPADSAGGYTVVGHVTSGLDQLIASVTSLGTADGSQDGVPASEVQISEFSIQ